MQEIQAWITFLLAIAMAFASTNTTNTEILVESNRNLYVVALLPVHQKGRTLFTCGQANSSEAIAQLATLEFALKSANQDAIYRTGITLGLVALDYCSQPLRAADQLYRLFGDGFANGRVNITSKSIVAAVSVEEIATTSVLQLMREMNIPLISAPTKQQFVPSEDDGDDTKPLFFSSLSSKIWIQAVADLLIEIDVDHVALVYSNSSYGEKSKDAFADLARERDICLLTSELAETSSEKDIQDMARTLSSSNSAYIAVLLNDIQQILSLAKYVSLFSPDKQIQFIVSDEVMSGYSSDQIPVNLLTVGLDSPNTPILRKFLTDVSPSKEEIFSNDWINEAWQNYFKCYLPGSGGKNGYSQECLGQRKKLADDSSMVPALDRLYLAVQGASIGMQNLLTRYCPRRDEITNIEECGPDSRLLMMEETHHALVGLEKRGQKSLLVNAAGNSDLTFTMVSDSGKKAMKVGLWRNGLVFMDASLLMIFKDGNYSQSQCDGRCLSFCTNTKTTSLSGDSAANFRSVWGIITSSLSAIGMLAAIMCFAYFIVVIPNSKGTTLLGYMILLGIVLLFAVNFAFICVPSHATCAVRRSLMGVAYSVILAAVLVKVVNTWRLVDAPSSNATTTSVLALSRNQTSDAKPAFLLLVAIAVASVQIILAVAWLILSPPSTIISGGFIRCYPHNSAEEQLVLSFLYILLLMLSIQVFAILTRESDENHKESKWILISNTVIILVWIVWTIIATQADVTQRDSAIVVANILCGFVLLLCLYVPKISLYNNLLQETRKLDIKAMYRQTFRRPTVVHPTTYDTLQSASSSLNSQSSYHHKNPLYIETAIKQPLQTSKQQTPSSTSRIKSGSRAQHNLRTPFHAHTYNGGSQFQPNVYSIYGRKACNLVRNGTTVSEPKKSPPRVNIEFY